MKWIIKMISGATGRISYGKTKYNNEADANSQARKMNSGTQIGEMGADGQILYHANSFAAVPEDGKDGDE